MAWIDITDSANWLPIVSAASAPSGLQFKARNSYAYDATDDTSNGVFFDYVGDHLWQPTSTVGTPPTDNFIPALRYIGPALSGLSGLRLTVVNRTDLPPVGFGGIACASIADDIIATGVTVLAGTEFVLEVTANPPTTIYGFSDVVDYETLLAHVYCMVVATDFDDLKMAPTPYFFDITKIEVNADPVGSFWTDFSNASES